MKINDIEKCKVKIRLCGHTSKTFNKGRVGVCGGKKEFFTVTIVVKNIICWLISWGKGTPSDLCVVGNIWLRPCEVMSSR